MSLNFACTVCPFVCLLAKITMFTAAIWATLQALSPSLIKGKVQVVLVCMRKVQRAHMFWRNNKFWPYVCHHSPGNLREKEGTITSCRIMPQLTQKFFNDFIRRVMQWASGLADGSFPDPEIWINMIIICGGHKEIFLHELKKICRDRRLIFQNKKPI
jgi:hypothetical protein